MSRRRLALFNGYLYNCFNMVPSFDKILFPLLDYIKDKDAIKISNIWIQVRDKYFNLSEEAKKETVKSGRNRFYDRIFWAKTYLYKAGLIDLVGRGEIKITEEGRKVIKEKENLTINDLYEYESFIEFKKRINKNIATNEDSVENKTPNDLINESIDEIEFEAKKNLLERLNTVNPYYFEKIILDLLKAMGYGDPIETPKSRDGGIDGIINEDELGLEQVCIQVKRFNDNSVTEKHVRDFIGAVTTRDAKKGIFVTTTDFNEGAIRLSEKTGQIKIILINGDALSDLMYKHGVGFQIKEKYEIKELDKEYFED